MSSDPASVTSGDLTAVRRAGRTVAVQISAALAAVLLLVGIIVAVAYARVQRDQIAEQLTTVASTADDVGDPPPGMELAFRDSDGAVSVSDGGQVGVPLLTGPAGFVDLEAGGRDYRAVVLDRPEGRVAALVDLAPFHAERARLLGALALAELTGIVAAVAVVALFTRRAVRPLAQALALQRRFVADASHELRAPLTVLHTRAQLLAGRLHAGDLAAATRDADALVADARVLGGVVDDLLVSATLTARAAARDRVVVGELAGAVAASVSAHADTLGVGLVCRVDGDSGSLEVSGSEAGLRRALTALVDNAIGHETPGGCVAVDVRRDGQQVLLAVSDTGPGIDRAAMATLFDRFSRGGGDLPRHGGRPSHGIGLALVRETVEAHLGTISVDSVPGRGATFTIALPAAPVL